MGWEEAIAVSQGDDALDQVVAAEMEKMDKLR